MLALARRLALRRYRHHRRTQPLPLTLYPAVKRTMRLVTDLPPELLSAIVLDCLAYRIGCVGPLLELASYLLLDELSAGPPFGGLLRTTWCSSCYEGLTRRWCLSRAHRGDQTRSTGVVRIAF